MDATLRPAAGLARVMVALALLAPFASPALAQAPTLHTDAALATAGFYRLSWDLAAEGDVRVELQEAHEPGFARPHRAYLGYDRATVVSGRSDGTYYYRIRRAGDGAPGPWSVVLAVQVEHHPLPRALGFFWVGAGVFTATLLLVVGGAAGARRRRRRY